MKSLPFSGSATSALDAKAGRKQAAVESNS
jgi:hypothetical protein